MLGGIVLLAPASPLRAQQIGAMPLGSEIKGFSMPQRNTAGEMEANIAGETAKAVSISRTAIQGLHVDLYSDGKVASVITAPKCDFWNLERRLSGSSGVAIQRADLQIRADSFDWDFKTQTALLRNNVHVGLGKFIVGVPAASAASPSSASSAPAAPTAPSTAPTP
ncbi:hypothetical protein [Verrucomicrobium sp. GAS474]|uniref:hypothetical protein n=1 Tax=Verrucomicrobium sp. GAS474 TaxID=1882831 RepID=UPI000B81937D|nr:hypothetical protein [Verrucomicrobium sp. GAS474]